VVFTCIKHHHITIEMMAMAQMMISNLLSRLIRIAVDSNRI